MQYLPRSNAYEILNACYDSLGAAAELIAVANLEIDHDSVQNRIQHKLSAASTKFISWLQEELLKYEGPL